MHAPGGMQPEKSWRSLDKATLMESFAINAVGPALAAKHVLPLLAREGKAVFAALSARVGSISDNRVGGWYGYRASKAALNQLIRTLSIERSRQRKDAICVGLHPGTVDSELSRPFQSGVGTAQLFTPVFAASRLLAIIEGLNATQSGRAYRMGWKHDCAVSGPSGRRKRTVCSRVKSSELTVSDHRLRFLHHMNEAAYPPAAERIVAAARNGVRGQKRPLVRREKAVIVCSDQFSNLFLSNCSDKTLGSKSNDMKSFASPLSSACSICS